ncbi:MAG: fused MFS/spermidine synthase [Verrucomicrobia bacterium]|nr:fused MFS/spermidine synthase [Verrucomicrobiota bacterium]
MRQKANWVCVGLAGLFALVAAAHAQVVFETTSAYHHILVSDNQGIRTLYFDHAPETRMALADPLKGHFEYTEYFHMPWLWNTNLKNVLMIGLGGASVARAYQRYYPEVMFEVVELDPKVWHVAKEFFGVQESRTLRIFIEDGRLHLRRSRKKYDAIFMDAYTANRYGSYIPYSLATTEFFTLTLDRLTENGVLAYNVIGKLPTSRRDGEIVPALYQTLKAVFPQVYLFPAARDYNVVLLATTSAEPATLPKLNQRADALAAGKWAKTPQFKLRLQSFRSELPAGAAKVQPLTDDFAPLDGMLNVAP